MNNDKVYQTYLERIDESSNVYMSYIKNNCGCISSMYANRAIIDPCISCAFRFDTKRGYYSCDINRNRVEFSLFLEKYYPERFL